MGEMRISDAQSRLLTSGAANLERVQSENNVMLAAMLAADGITEASNVEHNGNTLRWDEPDAETDISPKPTEDQLAKAAEALGAEVRASESQGPELAGESDGPEANAPEGKNEENVDPAVAPG